MINIKTIDIPLEFIKKNEILPVGNNKFLITKNTPFYAVEDIRFMYGITPETEIISEEQFKEKLEEYISNLESKIEEEGTEEGTENLEDILEGSDAPVIQLLNSTFLKAVRANASDIHFEPFSDYVEVRFRMDGVLHEMNRLPKSGYPAVVSRIKVMAKLNVAEKRLPQDGRIRIKIGNKEMDMRVSTLPTVFGERVVIRLLDKSTKILSLSELGYSDDDLEKIKNLISKPYGLVLVTGPTGSGKSTTLYASLLQLKSPRKNIITIEDPVEYQIDGISQIQVNPKINLTFANGLRSILRQDPDIVMVGEIRDLETAEIAIHASMTGHLVLSTLHTNDAPSAVTRLVDMGVEPFLVASSLEGVIAQRLVRRICQNCKTEYEMSDLEKAQIMKMTHLEPINLENKKLFKGTGCEECMNTGYKGRIAICEVMEVNEELRSVISKSPESNIIKQQALESGMKTLVKDGIEKALKGITTLEEVIQATKV